MKTFRVYKCRNVDISLHKEDSEIILQIVGYCIYMHSMQPLSCKRITSRLDYKRKCELKFEGEYCDIGSNPRKEQRLLKLVKREL